MNTWFKDNPDKSVGLQSQLTKLLNERRLAQRQPANKVDEQRIIANAAPEASLFWTTLPMTDATTLHDADFKTTVRLKLGRRAIERPLEKSVSGVT